MLSLQQRMVQLILILDGVNVVSGYGWHFENDLSVILGIGPAYRSWSKESENLKSDNGYGKDLEDRVKKLSFQPLVPLHSSL